MDFPVRNPDDKITIPATAINVTIAITSFLRTSEPAIAALVATIKIVTPHTPPQLALRMKNGWNACEYPSAFQSIPVTTPRSQSNVTQIIGAVKIAAGLNRFTTSEMLTQASTGNTETKITGSSSNG